MLPYSSDWQDVLQQESVCYLYLLFPFLLSSVHIYSEGCPVAGSVLVSFFFFAFIVSSEGCPAKGRSVRYQSYVSFIFLSRCLFGKTSCEQHMLQRAMQKCPGKV
jgi:hypothetical protein